MAKNIKPSSTGDASAIKPQSTTDNAQESPVKQTPVGIQVQTNAEKPVEANEEAPKKKEDSSHVTVNRAAFEKMMVALQMGHAQNYISQGLPRQIMDLFELKTRDEAVKKLQEMAASHRERNS